jgi:hypothetical protein
MNFRLLLEWDEQCGILLSKMYPLIDGVEGAFKDKVYGQSINTISTVMTCMAKDLKQRKRFKKGIGRFEYDILLDYYMIRNVPMDQKKGIIHKQMVEITERTFSTYKFADFNKTAFLSDFKEIINAVVW